MVDNGLTQNVALATVRFKVISELVFYLGSSLLLGLQTSVFGHMSDYRTVKARIQTGPVHRDSLNRSNLV